jgi:hypothetical protein
LVTKGIFWILMSEPGTTGTTAAPAEAAPADAQAESNDSAQNSTASLCILRLSGHSLIACAETAASKKKGTTYEDLLQTTMKLRDVAVKDAEAHRKAKKEYARLQCSAELTRRGTPPILPTT